MSVESKTAASYLERAKQLRAIADLDADKKTSATLRKIASNYEKLAASFTALDASQEREAAQVLKYSLA